MLYLGVGTFIAAFCDHQGVGSAAEHTMPNAHPSKRSYTEAQATRCVLKHQVGISGDKAVFSYLAVGWGWWVGGGEIRSTQE